MKKIYTFLILSVFVFLPVSCNFFKDQIDELYAEVDSLKLSDNILRQRVEQMNSSLTTLKGLVSAMQSGLYIKSVVTLSGDSDQGGYLITMSNGVTYTIRNGKDGQDGMSPKLGVRIGPDGAYYWTLDGEFLKDVNGNNVRADGATPLFDIREGFWYISLDGGTSWENLGRASGEDGLPGAPGDQIFKLVEYTPGENVVRFVLSDDTSITLPCYQPIAISFNVPSNQTSINAGETIKVDYSLSYGDENTVVTASSDGNYIVNVQSRDAVSGSILITCPGLYQDGHVNVMAFDGVGYATVAVITFYEKRMSFDGGLIYNVPTEGASLEIPVFYNFGYTLEPVGDAGEWISIVSTRTEMEEGVIRLDVARNDGDPRTGKVNLVPENAVSGPYAVITINQDGAYFEIGKSSFLFGSSGGKAQVSIRTSIQFAADVPSEAASWVTLKNTKQQENQYLIEVSVGENGTESKRSVSIPITNPSNGKVLGTIEILQLFGSGNNEMDMVFEVSANESNEYTVYLPVNGNDGNDFTVDWGDGTFEKVNGSISDHDSPVSHTYKEITGSGKLFRVTLSGTVTRLNSSMIPEGLRSGIVSVIQWGHTGLRDMSYAFGGNTRLTSLPDDETLAFGEVNSFAYAFSSCPRLVEIPPGLFQSATKASNFNRVFYNCESLSILPESLFSFCSSALNFVGAFMSCKNLKSLPSRLFDIERAESFREVFRDCPRLTTIPEDLFYHCTNVVTYWLAFYHCYSLEVVPEKLFSYSPNVINMDGIFENTALRQIPVGLFASNPKVESFASSFRECRNLTSVPEHLFDACTSVSSVELLFYHCYGLATVPSNIFDNLRKIANFNGCFESCNIEGESPYTWVGNRKVHLYERSEFPDYFVTPTYHEGVFRNAWSMIDYEDVPADWK